MKRMPVLLLSLASVLLLLPGCLSESIKTMDECASLAPPASGENWAGTEISKYGDAYAYEQVGCWHEAAIWHAIKGEGYNAVQSCENIKNVQWDYPSWLDSEHSVCISDVAEKLGDTTVCQQILDVESNNYIRTRCIARAEKAAEAEGRQFCGSTIFILAGLGAFLFANSKSER